MKIKIIAGISGLLTACFLLAAVAVYAPNAEAKGFSSSRSSSFSSARSSSFSRSSSMSRSRPSSSVARSRASTSQKAAISNRQSANRVKNGSVSSYKAPPRRVSSPLTARSSNYKPTYRYNTYNTYNRSYGGYGGGGMGFGGTLLTTMAGAYIGNALFHNFSYTGGDDGKAEANVAQPVQQPQQDPADLGLLPDDAPLMMSPSFYKLGGNL
jgi:hypothetical protein